MYVCCGSISSLVQILFSLVFNSLSYITQKHIMTCLLISLRTNLVAHHASINPLIFKDELNRLIFLLPLDGMRVHLSCDYSQYSIPQNPFIIHLGVEWYSEYPAQKLDTVTLPKGMNPNHLILRPVLTLTIRCSRSGAFQSSK